MAQPILSHGTIRLDPKINEWAIQCEPHVRIRLKNVFASMHVKAGLDQWHGLRISNTDAICRDLEWFCERYPLEISLADLKQLRAGSRRHQKRGEKMLEILAGDFQLPAVDMALPARPYQEQAAAALLTNGHLLLVDDLGLGKQQPVDTPVLTPSGWRPIGDLRVGDKVIGSTGRATRVKGVFPQGVRASYRLKFSDGSSVEAGDEHLWTVQYHGRPKGVVHRITVTTRDLRLGSKVPTHFGTRRTTKSLGKGAIYLPMLSGPVQFRRGKALPIPPYTLGALIANGYLDGASASLTTGTSDWKQIRAQLASEGVRLGATNVYGAATRTGIPGIMPALRQLGLTVRSAHKFIPMEYLRASIDNRIALLHGLMDGDGSCSKTRNRLSYHTMSHRLASDVCALVQELGGVATIRTYDRTHEDKGVGYVVRLRLPSAIAPFCLRRKARRYHPSLRKEPTRRFLGAEYVRNVKSVCIQVAARDGLYVTASCIVTHNTVVAIRALADKRTLPALCVVDAPLTEQWAEEIRRFLPGMRVHVIRSRKLYDVDKEPGGPFHVFVISYAMLSAWEDMFLGKLRFIVFDEAQELRTGHDPKEFNVSQKNMAAYHLACQTDYRLGLTATPIYNYGGELWNLVDTLAPGILGTQDEFLREWCRGNDKRKAEVRDPKALGAYLKEEGIVMRRTRADVGRQLPPLTRIVHEITPSARKGFWKKDSAAAELARLVLDKGAKAFERMQAGAQLDVLLRQMTGVQKAPDVAAFVRMLLEQGTEKVLLYGWHREVYRIWDDLFEDYDPVWYTGSESPSKKRKDVLQFVEGDSRLLIMSLRSGRGLNRISEVCSTIVHGELDWSPGVMEQCDGRAHRDGQAQPVFSYYVVSTEGSDPIVSDVLGLKTSQIEGIRDPDGAALIERTIDPKHIQRLAESYLQKIGEHS